MFGVKKFLFAGGFIEDAQICLDLSLRSENFYATIGIHPSYSLSPYKGRLPEKCNDGTVLEAQERK